MHSLIKVLSNNHEITVYDTTELYGEKGNFRVLQFSNEAVQGAMDLDNPRRIVFEYPRAMIHLMEVNNPSFEHVFVIGHGIGTIAGHFSEKQVKVAELDDQVAELSKKCFGYSVDNIVIGDGRQILESEAPKAYDFIVLDAFTEKGTPRHFTTKEFFRTTQEKLDSRGSIIMNLLGKGEHDKLINAIHTTLGEVFPYTKSFLLLSADISFNSQNLIMMGSNMPIRFQARHMAGFLEVELEQGHIILDH